MLPSRQAGSDRCLLISLSWLTVTDNPPAASSLPRRPTSQPNRFLIPSAGLPPGFAEQVGSVAEPAPARPAATVALLRLGAEAFPEVLLLRRHRRSGFAADAWVFPGGTVDAEDLHPALPVLCDGPAPAEWAERLALADAAAAFGYVAAAIREAFEETGILIAHTGPGGGSAGFLEARERAMPFRARILGRETGLREMAAEAQLRYAADRLAYIARWITPEPEPRRYDTRFFIAAAPDGAVCEPHQPELVDARWLTPKAALDAYGAGDLIMLPPTVHTLQRLQPFSTVEEALRDLAAAPAPSIMPRMRRDPEGVVIEW